MTFHLKAAENTFLLSAQGTFFRIDHILGHKSSLSKFEKTEIISSIFSDHTMRLEINYKKKKKPVKNENTQRLKYMLLNNQEVTLQIKKETIQYLETNDNEDMMTPNLWDTVKAVEREKFTQQFNPTSRHKKNIK